MLKYICCVIVISFSFTSCKKETVPPDTMQQPATEQEYTYLALGDSYTIGEGVPEADRWGVQLADLLRQKGVRIGNPYTVARTGWTTAELSAAIDRAEIAQKFDLVSLMIGVNNQYRGQSLETYRLEFRELLQVALRFSDNRPAHVMVLSIPDWGATPFGRNHNRERIASEIDAFNAVAKDEAAKAGVTFIDITPLTRTVAGDGALVAGDGLHYSGKMHLEWAKLALPEAQKVLK